MFIQASNLFGLVWVIPVHRWIVDSVVLHRVSSVRLYFGPVSKPNSPPLRFSFRLGFQRLI